MKDRLRRARNARFDDARSRTLAGSAVDGVIVTTSWDDGHVLDHQLATMLDTFDLPATFYIAPHNVEIRPRERLDRHGIACLGQRFEIGAHTMRHVRLPSLTPVAAQREIAEGQEYLENLLSSPVRSFCYVGGEFGPEHQQMVADRGFRLARTVQRNVTGLSRPMSLATTVHAYRHLLDWPVARAVADHDPRRARRYYANWDELAMALFDRTLATGGIFHLWGHSWEIDRNGDWDRLERVLAHIGRRPGVRYLTNGELPLAGVTP